MNDLKPIDVLDLSWEGLVAWLNTGESADITLRTNVLMKQYLIGWRDVLIDVTLAGNKKITKLTPDGIADLMWLKFPEECKRVLPSLTPGKEVR